jgi:hypothetical protein
VCSFHQAPDRKYPDFIIGKRTRGIYYGVPRPLSSGGEGVRS